jgi:hypothetical protein
MASIAWAAFLVLGCATGRSIESRPTPPPPQPGPVTAGPPPTPRVTGRPRIVADTLAARTALRRCAGRTLLPEQESTVESTTSLLMQARRALLAGDLARAGVLAREARSIAQTLGCP